jgi:hypothetical protein
LVLLLGFVLGSATAFQVAVSPPVHAVSTARTCAPIALFSSRAKAPAKKAAVKKAVVKKAAVKKASKAPAKKVAKKIAKAPAKKVAVKAPAKKPVAKPIAKKPVATTSAATAERQRQQAYKMRQARLADKYKDVVKRKAAEDRRLSYERDQRVAKLVKAKMDARKLKQAQIDEEKKRASARKEGRVYRI